MTYQTYITNYIDIHINLIGYVNCTLYSIHYTLHNIYTTYNIIMYDICYRRYI